MHDKGWACAHPLLIHIERPTMNFQDLHELPAWLKTTITLLLGAGGARLVAIWLENHRLEKKDYRDTLLGRIRELEETISGMQDSFTTMSVNLALAKDESTELRQEIEVLRRINAQQESNRRAGGPDAKPSQSV